MTLGGYEVPAIFKNRRLQEELAGRLEAMLEAEREEVPSYELGDDDVEVALGDLEDIGDLGGRDLESARRWLIARGVYREVTAAELERTVEVRGNRTRRGKADFRVDGRSYVFDRHLGR